VSDRGTTNRFIRILDRKVDPMERGSPPEFIVFHIQ